MKTRYLVTGAADHLGTAVVRALTARGDAVRALVLPGEAHLPEHPVELVYGDVRNRESLEPLFRQEPDEELVVIHCAGVVSITARPGPNLRAVNVGGTQNIVDLCLAHHVKKLIYVSSVHAIPELPRPERIAEIGNFNPDQVVGAYAKTKAEATAYVLRAAGAGLNASVVHPSGILGPYDWGMGHLTALVMDYCRHRLTAGVQGGYDFVDVRDVAGGILACCKRGRPGACYILSGHYASVRDLLAMLHEITGQKPVKTYLPLWFARLTAPLSEQYYRLRRQPPLYTSYSLYTLETNASFSHARASLELKYHPRPLRQTLTETVAWLRSQGRLPAVTC